MKTNTLDQVRVVKRPAGERGSTELGWLHSRHSFSFGEYYDPAHMGFRSLRVINDDWVDPGQGFGAHPHRNAEIFSYVIEGELEHKDNMGNGRVIKAGDLQYMSAGDGVVHGEFNPSQTKPVHFLQVWILPGAPGGKPRYAERTLGQAARPNDLTLLFAPEPRDGAIAIRADAEVFFGRLDAGRELNFASSPEKGLWVHVIKGEIGVLGETLGTGDGVAIENAERLKVAASENAEFLLFALGGR
ncbi:MAG TPA: pirin family protein [Verrucomicrobiae bacterium]|nr:pirin family protein [Verrucomicrobiae bacterium]